MKSSESGFPDFDESTRPRWVRAEEDAESRDGAGSELARIHDHLRGEAEGLLQAIDNYIEGRESIVRARSILAELSARQGYSGVGSLCSGFCTLLTLHHSIEDRSVFPGLARALPELKPVLARLMAEHEVVAAIIAVVYEAIEATEENRAEAMRLKTAAAYLCDRLTSHLAYEESQLVLALNIYG